METEATPQPEEQPGPEEGTEEELEETGERPDEAGSPTTRDHPPQEEPGVTEEAVERGDE